MATNNTLNNTADNLLVSSGFTVSSGAVSILTGTSNIDIGNAAGSKTITIGNTTGASALNVIMGTGNCIATSSSNGLFTIYSSGYATFPSNPAFYCYLASPVTNVTGNGTVYTLGTGSTLTKLFDRSNECSTAGLFTVTTSAAGSGIFFFTTTVHLTGIAVGETTCNLSINSTQAILQTNWNILNMSQSGAASLTAVHICNMNFTNTTRVQLTISGGASNGVGIGTNSFFAGFRIA